MEKFSQFRDRGSGISPFIPVTTPSSPLAATFHVLLFLFRLPLFLSYAALYFLVLHHLPLPAVARKLLLWLLLAIPGIWWVDLQLDGVKRGSLSQQPASRVPHPRSIIAANFTSPIDALYLAAVFDPIFVAAPHPRSRKVRRISLLRAVCAALSAPAQHLTDDSSSSSSSSSSPSSSSLTDLRALLARHPDRVVAVFPECGTTNGRGVLPLGACLLAAPADAAVFPVSLRYTPPDVTTPVPGARAWLAFLWKLLGRPTHCIRVRIAEGVYNTSHASNGVPPAREGGSQQQQQHQQEVAAAGGGGSGDGVEGGSHGDDPTEEEQRLLDRVAEALARLGRARRVGLTLRDKKAFVAAWTKGRK